MNGITNKALKRRIIEISFKNKLSHIGSCITAADIIDEIYTTKKTRVFKGSDEKFILSSGHAGLALYVVLEKYFPFIDAELLLKKHGIHPNYDPINHIDCSTGSLGQGLPIAVGMALADRTKNVYCLISDGECAEGSIWEALRIIEDKRISNIKVYVNWNDYGAYEGSSGWAYQKLMTADSYDYNIFVKHTDSDQLPFLHGQDAHYYAMTEEDYKIAMEVLK